MSISFGSVLTLLIRRLSFTVMSVDGVRLHPMSRSSWARSSQPKRSRCFAHPGPCGSGYAKAATAAGFSSMKAAESGGAGAT